MINFKQLNTDSYECLEIKHIYDSLNLISEFILEYLNKFPSSYKPIALKLKIGLFEITLRNGNITHKTISDNFGIYTEFKTFDIIIWFNDGSWSEYYWENMDVHSDLDSTWNQFKRPSIPKSTLFIQRGKR